MASWPPGGAASQLFTASQEDTRSWLPSSISIKLCTHPRACDARGCSSCCYYRMCVEHMNAHDTSVGNKLGPLSGLRVPMTVPHGICRTSYMYCSSSFVLAIDCDTRDCKSRCQRAACIKEICNVQLLHVALAQLQVSSTHLSSKQRRCAWQRTDARHVAQ